jgi:hypothetical protein
VINGGKKLLTDPDLLLFLVLVQKLLDPSCQLLHKPQLIMQDVLYDAIRYPMGSRQIHAGPIAVGLQVGGNRGDNVQVLFIFFMFRCR